MISIKQYLLSLTQRIQHVEKEQWILVGCILLYILYFTFFTFQKHELFLTGRYDLGNMDQTVWNTSQGRIFTFTNPDFDQVMSRLSVHSDFILILIAPFYFIWSDPRVLLFIQTVIIASGTIFVYLLGKKILLQNTLPLIFAISYLLNPFIQRQNNFDFHAVSLATTFLLGAFYFIEKNRIKYFFLFLILAVLTKEHIYLISALFGLYVWIGKKKKWGILITLISAITFYSLITWFIPQARGQEHFALSNYDKLGESPSRIALTILTDPIKTIKTILDHNVFPYMGLLFMPVGFMSILSPGFFLFALPEFMVNVLSRNSAFRDYYYHYAAATIPFIYISAILGIKKIVQSFPSPKVNAALCCYILCSSLFAAWLAGPLPGSKNADLTIYQNRVSTKPIHEYLDRIPKNISVGATNNLAAHLVHREKIYSIANGIKNADLILFLITKSKDKNRETIENLRKNPDFHIAYQRENFIVFKRNTLSD